MNSKDLQLLKMGEEQAYLIPKSDYELALQLQYLEWKDKFLSQQGDKKSQRILLNQLSEDMISKTFLSGCNLRVIDLVIAEIIQEHVQNLSFDEKESLHGLLRWYSTVQKHQPCLVAIPFQRTKIY
ncbi:unnamed protein product [Hymenolepis diminuta]|uniref:GST C-terminal domain-containing protein n=1 Tax=Hymenolepis diminuta TaxID=6216 RepID=A0A564YZ15_HYMDI|nr:unnamed protein product [Hymenolepis diminuta]